MGSRRCVVSDNWSAYFEQSLTARADAGLHRTRGAGVIGAGILDFGSNDYLGLRDHPQILSALRSGQTAGSGASPVLTGHTSDHRELESQLADLSQMEDALVFSSGYACHSGVVECLAGAGDLILSDELNHASLIAGCRLSRAQVHVFPHNDARYLESLLKEQRTRYGKVMLLTESVFSMDGDFAPLDELVRLCHAYDVGLVVDEAHAMGLFGRRGAGLLEELRLEQHILAKLGTLSKAAGGVGGYVCGSSRLIDYLVNHCRSYIFSTAPPIPNVKAAQAALELIDSMETERCRLRKVSADFRRRLRNMGWNAPDGESPILPIMVGDAERAQVLSRRLQEQRIHVPAIRPPTVPPGTSRLRVSLSARHTAAELDELAEQLAKNCTFST